MPAGQHRGRRAVAGTVALTVATTGLAALVMPQSAAAANADIGLPVFSGSANPVPDTGTAFSAGGELQAIFDADVAAGAGTDTDHDFWVDKMLARTGNQPGGSNGDANQYLFSRGRAVFMKTHEPGTLGFGGEVAYWESISGGKGAYTMKVLVDGAPVTLTEVAAQRKQTPSYWRSVFTSTAAHLQVVETKFITQNNVAVTELSITSTDGTARTVTVQATSPFAAQADGAELTGAVKALNDITTIFPRLSGDGMTPADGSLSGDFDVPATGAVTTKVQMGFVTKEIPASRTDYDTYRQASVAAAYKKHVTTYNQWWADNIPYLDTPEDNIDKTLFYRWWLLRFNFLDADVPGNDYQFPTSVEGALGYNNAIDLTIGMFLDDLKYLRDPVYSYGTWLSAGETAGSAGQYRDNPGDPANWSASHTQYISESAWQSYQVHGGPASVAHQIGTYAERDTAGELSTLDSNGNYLLDTNWNAWTGNDADAVSFDYYPGQRLERPETAYVYSGAKAGAEAFTVSGETARATALEGTADKIKNAVLTQLWDPTKKLILDKTVGGQQVPWKEINNYYPYSVGLMPKPGDADYTDDYADALRLFADDAQFPIFPFYTANQADKAEAAAAGHAGSNNFSIINSTVTFRMLSSALRNYPTSGLNADWYKKLLYWNAWAHYQNNGDNRYPDQNEFWADGSADPQNIGYRSWIHHTQLGTTNWTVIEDAMGLRPRTDDKIELDPIDIGWDHFSADNLSYHGKNLTITWDAPGGTRYYGNDVPEGYSVFVDGKLAFTADKLAHVTYDPATGTVDKPTGVTVTNTATAALPAAQDVTFASGSRVVDALAKAGAPAASTDDSAVDVAAGKPVTASFTASGRTAAKAVDGLTTMESFWGTAGSPNASDSLTIDVANGGAAVPVNDVRVYFYRTSTTATAQGYAAPSQYLVEYNDGSGWKAVPDQARASVYPQGNYNQVQFPTVSAKQLRITVQHAAGSKTGIKEVEAYQSTATAPAPTAAGPHAEAWIDSGYNQTGSARMVGLTQGDGSSATPVTASWSVVDAPDGGKALFADAASASTVVRFSTAGQYTLRLTATQGDETSTADVVVQATALQEGAVNVATSATPTASYTAGWNNVNAVNDGKPAFFSGGNQTDLWGTWTGAEPATRWLQYTFAKPVRVNQASIDFWYDSTSGGSGVSVPKDWTLQYWDDSASGGAGGWVDVPNPSGFTATADKTNVVTFDAVTTTRLRATFNALANSAGTAYSAVGVSEWRVFAAPATSVDPVDVRTTIGTQPTLPSTVTVNYEDGTRLATPVTWDTIDDSELAQEGSVTVSGVLATTTIPAQATVWVRSTLGQTVTTVSPVEVATSVGVAPQLPDTVTVQYNDGTRVSGVAVTWAAIDPSSYDSDGEFVVRGTVAGTDIQATATVVVGTGAGDHDPTVDLSTTPAQPTGENGWWTGPVTVNASGSDRDNDLTSTEISVDGGAWAAGTSTGAASVQLTTDGRHTVSARATDARDAVSDVASTAINIDATAPVSNATLDTRARTVALRSADDTSGVARVEYRVGTTGDWSTYLSPVKVGSAATTVQYRAVDTAGNVETTNAASLPAAGVVLKGTSTAAVVAPASTTYGKASKVTVRVSGSGGTPTGTVRVTDGKVLVGTATLSSGRATVALSSKLAVGRHNLTVTYSGDKAFASSTDTGTLTVTKTTSKTSVAVSPKSPTHSQRAVVTARVSTVQPTGTVTIKVTHSVKGKTKSVVSKRVVLTKQGVATLKLPKLAKGTYKVSVSYGGSTTAKASSASKTISVRK